MRKIHKISYDKLFGQGFKTSAIDQKLDDLDLEEKLMIIDNVIDYIYTNFDLLKNQREQEKLNELKLKTKSNFSTGRTSRTKKMEIKSEQSTDTEGDADETQNAVDVE